MAHTETSLSTIQGQMKTYTSKIYFYCYSIFAFLYLADVLVGIFLLEFKLRSDEFLKYTELDRDYSFKRNVPDIIESILLSIFVLDIALKFYNYAKLSPMSVNSFTPNNFRVYNPKYFRFLLIWFSLPLLLPFSSSMSLPSLLFSQDFSSLDVVLRFLTFSYAGIR